MTVMTVLVHGHYRDARNPYLQATKAVERTVAIAQGKPVPQPEPPVPLRCPICRHFTVRHTGEPGRGCRHHGCLCLETPRLICEEAIR